MRNSTFIRPVKIVLGIMILLLTSHFYNFVCVAAPYFEDNEIYVKCVNQSYDWKQMPPQTSDSTNMQCLISYWDPYRFGLDNQKDDKTMFYVRSMNIPVVRDDENVYLKMVSFSQPKYGPDSDKRDIYEGWIKAVIEGDSLRFPNNELIAYSNYDMIRRQYFTYDIYSRMDTILDYKDTVVSYSIKIGEEIQMEPYALPCYQAVPMLEIEYLNRDMKAYYNPQTGLISNPDAGLFITNERPPYLKNWYLKDGMAINKLLIGPIADDEEVTSIHPVVTYTFEKNGQYSDLTLYTDLDIITDNGKLLDVNKIHVDISAAYEKYSYTPMSGGIDSYYWDDTDHKDFLSVASPFNDNSNYFFRSNIITLDRLEVMVYYEKDDGTKVGTPWFVPTNVTGINNIYDDRGNDVLESGSDRTGRFADKVFDLTGREVNSENLTPGIYIKNGRKFAVGAK